MMNDEEKTGSEEEQKSGRAGKTIKGNQSNLWTLFFFVDIRVIRGLFFVSHFVLHEASEIFILKGFVIKGRKKMGGYQYSHG